VDLFDRLASWENLVSAARAARRGKPKTAALVSFEADREANLARLRGELLMGSYAPGVPRQFSIYEPKPRLISAAPYRDRVVHHAIVQVLDPLWEPSFLFHSYACRRGKGLHAAVEACSRFARRYPWVLRADVQKFYPSVDHEVLCGILRRRVQSPRVLALLDLVLASAGADAAPLSWYPGDDLFSPVVRPKGLPIGNLTSQFFANVYLDAVDHRMTDERGFAAYVRYMDDVLVFGATLDEVRAARDALEEVLRDARLRLHARKQNLIPSERGIPFLGFRVFPDHRRLRTSVKVRQGRRLRDRARAFAASDITMEDARSSVMAMEGHARWANTGHLRRRRLALTIFSRSG